MREMKKNRERKMPSYYFNARVLCKAISRAYVDPNWIRIEPRYRRSAAPTIPTALELWEHRRDLTRTFYFKTFRQYIGVTGTGYCHNREDDSKPCNCSTVLIDGRTGLVTSYPLKKSDAELTGRGPCKYYSDEKEDMPDFSERDDEDGSTTSRSITEQDRT
uniref:Uncharacterized protein n=1 Tax=Trichuris muris TaxID=70415 RepID=A0A5S6Q9D8_TRIMR